MRLINIKALLEREQLMSTGKQIDRRTKIVEFRDDEATEYAILSHRWVCPTEVDYEEMVSLAKMDTQERDEIRGRLGYKKILETCQQANEDGYEWAWIDTCCIDKRSSAELSEAINSMYRWYGNAKACYAYLHDVHGPSFPTEKDDQKYPKSNGWPEWFSRGWTLQEMIAPSNVQFFNERWQAIGDKKTLATTLTRITRVPEHVLMQGLFENRPCIAQIISWAAKRTTTRVEDRAYSLMGLLDVNMSMLYGEGKKAFHRLQLHIIHSSNDQSIFAWGHSSPDVRTGSILADDPNFFCDCSDMELMDYDELILSLKRVDPEVKLPSIGQDCFGVFPTTNRGIHIWMPLRHHRASTSVFEAYLPCRKGSFAVKINLVLWNSNYYRYSGVYPSGEGPLQFRQVYLRYEDIPSCNVTFEIDDGAIAEEFGCCHTYPSKLTPNTITLTNANSLSVKTYSERQGDGRFAVAFGQCFGLDWVYMINYLPGEFDCLDELQLLVKVPDRARSMADIPAQGDCRRRLWVQHFHVSTWIVRISRVVWERSIIGVRMEVFRDSHVHRNLEWKTFDIDRGNFSRDMSSLMLRDRSCKRILRVDGFEVEFSLADKGTALGDYGYFSSSGHFYRQGNVFVDVQSLVSEADIVPSQQIVTTVDSWNSLITVVDNLGLSLPSNHTFNSSLASLSSRLTNAYLVTRVVQCRPTVAPDNTMTFCTMRKPFVWHRDGFPSTSF